VPKAGHLVIHGCFIVLLFIKEPKSIRFASIQFGMDAGSPSLGYWGEAESLPPSMTFVTLLDERGNSRIAWSLTVVAIIASKSLEP